MFTRKADHPDETFSFRFSGKDSEGNTIPPDTIGQLFKVDNLTGDNDSACRIVSLDSENNKVILHYGAPNADGTPSVANFQGQVVDRQTGEPVGTVADQIIVVPGELDRTTLVATMTPDTPEPEPIPTPGGDTGTEGVTISE